MSIPSWLFILCDRQFAVRRTWCCHVPTMFWHKQNQSLLLKIVSITTVVTLLWLATLLHIFSKLALQNGHIESVQLLDALQICSLADGLPHVISRKRNLPMMNNADSHGNRISTIDGQACVICSGCSSILLFRHGELNLKPAWNTVKFFRSQLLPECN